MNGHRFNFLGRIVLVRWEGGLWQAYALGADGECAPAGFVVPAFIEVADMQQYLFDTFHESARPGNGEVRRMP